MFTVHVDQHVQLDSAINVYLLSLPVAHHLRLERTITDLRQHILTSTEHSIALHSQMPRTFKNIPQIEVDHVITRDEVRVIGDNEFLKVEKHIFLFV